MPLDEAPITEPIEGVEPVELHNYAADPAVLDKLKKDICPILKRARDNRKAKVENDWLRYRDIYNQRRTITFYDGRSKLFLGALRKAVDTLTRVAKDSMLADPYISVETEVERWREVGVHFIKYLLENQAQIRPKMSMFLRQLYQIGTSCIKFGFKSSYRTVSYREREEESGASQIKQRKCYDHYGPTVDVVDMLHVYVWPETAVDTRGLQMIFEDSVTRVADLRAKAEQGWYDPAVVERVIEVRSKKLEEEKRSNSQTNKEGLADTDIDESELDITELWVRFKLPEDKNPDENLPFVWVTLAGEEILRVQENPWWFQMPPYLFGAIFREHDYFYGHGLIEAGEMWQYMLNDLVNQTMDVQTFSLNPIAIMDPMLIDDPDMYQVEPGAKWLIDPNAIKFDRPPGQMAAEGLGMVRFLLNVIQENSDATALMQGSPREGLGRATQTATGVSQLFAASNAAVVDQVEELESQVFTPLLHMTEIAAHQFMEDEMTLRLEGQDAAILTQRIISPQDLVLSADVRWIASRRLREKLAKGQQYLNLLNLALGVDPARTIQQGFVIDLKQVVKGAAISIGAEDADKIIKDVTQSMPGVPVELEYELAIAGRSVIASPFEPIETHMLKIQALMALPVPESEFARVKIQELIASHFSAIQQVQAQQQAAMQGAPGAAPHGPVGGASPIRPQEMPINAVEGAASQGILSEIGG